MKERPCLLGILVVLFAFLLLCMIALSGCKQGVADAMPNAHWKIQTNGSTYYSERRPSFFDNVCIFHDAGTGRTVILVYIPTLVTEIVPDVSEPLPHIGEGEMK